MNGLRRKDDIMKTNAGDQKQKNKTTVFNLSFRREIFYHIDTRRLRLLYYNLQSFYDAMW